MEAESLRSEFNENLSLSLDKLRLINVYDLFGFSDELVEKCRYSVFGETVTDTVTDSIDLTGKKYLAVEYIPGQFDQRASSAVDCVHLIDPAADIRIKSARLLVFDDSLPYASRVPVCWFSMTVSRRTLSTALPITSSTLWNVAARTFPC